MAHLPSNGYYEVASSPLLSLDGSTVYYVLGVTGLGYGPAVVAVNVNDGSVKWVLNEGDDDGQKIGWADLCPGADGIFANISGSGTSALLSDGSIVFGTWTGCLVRVVDQGFYGTTDGVTAHTGGIFGIAVEEKNDLEGDRIYVATTGANRNAPGNLSKTSLLRLTDDQYPDLEWVFEAGKAVSSGWLGNAAGILSSPVLYHDETEEKTFLYMIVTDWSDTTDGGGWGDPERGWIVKVPADGPFDTHLLGPPPPVGAGQQWIYEDTPVDILPLEVNSIGYPAFNCTMDGKDAIWIHGGNNRPDGGKILRTDKDLTSLVAVSSGDTARYGFSEILLGDDFLYAVAMGAWYPKEVRNDKEKPTDWHDNFRPVVYKLGDANRVKNWERRRKIDGRRVVRPEE